MYVVFLCVCVGCDRPPPAEDSKCVLIGRRPAFFSCDGPPPTECSKSFLLGRFIFFRNHSCIAFFYCDASPPPDEKSTSVLLNRLSVLNPSLFFFGSDGFRAAETLKITTIHTKTHTQKHKKTQQPQQPKTQQQYL